MNRFAPYAKSIVAFLVPGVLAIQTAMQDSSPGGSAVTPNEWLAAGLLCVSSAGLVWAVPNTPKAAEPAPAPVATEPAPVAVAEPASAVPPTA